MFSSYDIERLQTTPILFQTGYLTIKSKGEYGLYQLGYPNQEVRASLLMYFADERPKRLLGINFSSESKTVDDWKLEEYGP